MRRLFSIAFALASVPLLAFCGGASSTSFDAGPDFASSNATDAHLDVARCTVDLYYHVVCGEDGVTYANDDYAVFCGHTKVAHAGPCTDGGADGG